LDSIDALELGVAIQKRYEITLSANSAETRRHFASVRTLSMLIGSNWKSEENLHDSGHSKD
jgi:acyl carrier protein